MIEVSPMRAGFYAVRYTYRGTVAAKVSYHATREAALARYELCRDNPTIGAAAWGLVDRSGTLATIATWFREPQRTIALASVGEAARSEGPMRGRWGDLARD